MLRVVVLFHSGPKATFIYRFCALTVTAVWRAQGSRSAVDGHKFLVSGAQPWSRCEEEGLARADNGRSDKSLSESCWDINAALRTQICSYCWQNRPFQTSLLTSAYVCLKREIVQGKATEVDWKCFLVPDWLVLCTSTVKPPGSINPSISVWKPMRKPKHVLVR